MTRHKTKHPWTEKASFKRDVLPEEATKREMATELVATLGAASELMNAMSDAFYADTYKGGYYSRMTQELQNIKSSFEEVYKEELDDDGKPILGGVVEEPESCEFEVKYDCEDEEWYTDNGLGFDAKSLSQLIADVLKFYPNASIRSESCWFTLKGRRVTHIVDVRTEKRLGGYYNVYARPNVTEESARAYSGVLAQCVEVMRELVKE
jgi:hypothetical protein